MNNLELAKSLGVNFSGKEQAATTVETDKQEQEKQETETTERDVSSDTEEKQKEKVPNKENEKHEVEVTDGEPLDLFAALGMEAPKKKKEKKSNNKAKVTPKEKADALEKDKLKIVKAYGQEVMRIEKGEKADLEEIRSYLVETLGYREFQKEDTEMIITNDAENDTQYIIPQPKLRPKG